MFMFSRAHSRRSLIESVGKSAMSRWKNTLLKAGTKRFISRHSFSSLLFTSSRQMAEIFLRVVRSFTPAFSSVSLCDSSSVIRPIW